jgi:site-specific DNA-methyltransferase (adenine-specific)
MLYSLDNGNHLIYHGDILSVLQDVPDSSIPLIFIDCPYNIGKTFGSRKESWKSDQDYLEWCYTWLDLCVSKLTSQGSMYIMSSTQFIPYIDIYVRDKLIVLSRIVWAYDSSGVQAKRYFGSLYEPILFCVRDSKNYTFNAADIKVEAKTGAKRRLIDYRKKEPRVYNTTKVPGNVWYFPRVRYRMPEYQKHPSQKPESLLERILLASSNEGDTVLDPFAGSFTTAAVGKRLGRKTISIELEGEYVENGIKRLRST